MSIVDAIQQALEEANPPPPNESTTCEWVIYPLLQAAGYARRDIISRIADNNGQYPDYTLLPDTPHTWFLEAKAWNNALQDTHAQQSLNYANQNGKRWVVLTNGRVWRLYDNDIRGVAADKFVAEVRLEDIPSAEAFLTAIGKTSVCNDGLERYASGARLGAILQSQLQDPASDLMRVIVRALRSQPGLSSIANTDVVAYFRKVSASPSPTKAENKQRPAKPEPISRKGEQNAYSLDVLVANTSRYVTGKKPTLLVLPDGSQVPVRGWVDVAFEVVQWLGQRHELPLPFPEKGKPRKKAQGIAYFLNSTPDHEKGPMNKSRQLDTAKQTLFLHTNRSAGDFLHLIFVLSKHLGVDPSTFTIRIQT